MKLLKIITVSLLASAFSTFVLVQLWRWYIVPCGAPDFGYLRAYGASLIVYHLLFKPESGSSSDSSDDVLEAIKKRAGYSTTILLVGFIVHFFV